MRPRIPVFDFILKFLPLCFAAGCYKNHLYVQQEKIDESYLASAHIPGAPDPRKGHFPKGQKLLISWAFPKNLFEEELELRITVRFWDNTEQMFVEPVERKRSYADLFFTSQILTYKIDVFTKGGELIETWKHHFWTELIEVGATASEQGQGQHLHP